MALHIAALLVFIALFPLVALIPMRVLASVSARWRAARERQHLGRLDGQGSHAVKGILRVEGPLQQSDGAPPLGAVSTWSSARRFWFKRPKHVDRERAERLTLVAGNQRYELSGPVEVLSGSRTAFSGVRAEAWDRKAFAVRTCLFDGDEVTVTGVASGAVEGQEYRGRGATVLEPSLEAGVIFACATRAPATVVPLKALLRHFSVPLLMLVASGPLIRFAGDYSDTDCAEPCKSSGSCSIVSNFGLRSFRKALAKLYEGDHVDCAATSDDMCRASTYCAEIGHCTAEAGSCIASTADDCLDTPGCLAFGTCSPSQGFCRALTVEDCRYTQSCVEYGHCIPRDGACLLASDESCQWLSECAEYGRCRALDGSCAAVERTDCAATEGCLEHGRCSPVDGSCRVATDADCLQTSQCRQYGKCSLVDGECAAKTDEDCRGSRRCAEARECAAKGGQCVRDAFPCRESAACTHWGACAGDGFCEAGSKADCAKAAVCRGKADCRPLAASCASSCPETESCRRYGLCTPKGKNECVAGSDADCASSKMCREIGYCSLREGQCALTSAADCRRASGCKYGRRCSFVEGRCDATAADCEATPGCKLLGKCSYADYRCVVKSAEDCKKSEVCEKRGWCTPVRPKFAIDEQCGPAPR